MTEEARNPGDIKPYTRPRHVQKNHPCSIRHVHGLSHVPSSIGFESRQDLRCSGLSRIFTTYRNALNRGSGA